MTKFLIPAIAIGGLLFGTDCGASAMELVAPIQEKGEEVIDGVKRIFRVIAVLSIILAACSLAFPWFGDKKMFVTKIASSVFVASIIISKIDVVQAFLGLA